MKRYLAGMDNNYLVQILDSAANTRKLKRIPALN